MRFSHLNSWILKFCLALSLGCVLVSCQNKIKIQLKDVLKSSSVNSFSIAPLSKVVSPNNTVLFNTFGGKAPYHFEIYLGAGTVISNVGSFTAPASASTSLIKATDANGSIAYATIEVTDPLAINPNIKTISVNNHFSFSALGGKPPYVFSISSGAGSINSTTGEYIAPSITGVTIVQVADQDGAKSLAEVTIEPSLLISPAQVTVQVNGSRTFSASGGVGSITYSLVSGGGLIDPVSGIYYAPSAPGTAVVQAKDSIGNSSIANLTINNVLVINPPAITIAKNTVFNFSASGGQPPYTYSLQSVINGTVVSATGVYTAPDSPGGPYALTVTDSTGQSSEASITVTEALSFSVTNITLQVGESFDFGPFVNGGIPTYFYSIASSQGSFAGSIYTAPATAGIFYASVFDSQSPTPNAASGAVIVNPVLAIDPVVKTLSVNNTFGFSASGGVPPYAYSVQSGGGQINSSDGLYTAPSSAGATVVRVTDAHGHTAVSNVTINGALAIAPPTKVIQSGDSFTFTASGGVGSISYSLVSGEGSINPLSGQYTASAGTGSAVVRVTDILGNTSDATVIIVNSLSLAPSLALLQGGASIVFTASGGLAPYSYALISGDGVINSSTGAFTAASDPGQSVVRVTDALGTTQDSTITIYDGLAISPFAKTMTVSGSTIFTASGGVPPYVYSVSGGGVIDSATGSYTAPAIPGTATVTVMDAEFNTSNANVVISPTLEITPTTKTVALNNIASFVATGGIPPVAFSIVSGNGAINASTGDFTASSIAGTTTVRVSDSVGAIADAIVTINPSLIISPAVKTIAVNSIFNFTSTGGVGPYVYSVVSGGGSFSGFTYTAPATSGNVTVRSTDSLGNTSDATITVYPALIINPSILSLSLNNTTAFSATGGKLPYVFSILSGGGTINASSGEFIAPSSSGGVTVRVTDGDGNVSDSSVTIQPALAISPAVQTLAPFAQLNFTSSGGVGPYVFSRVSGFGSITADGIYTAPGISGTEIIRVSDSLGNTSDATITISAALSIAPSSKTLAVNNMFTFSATGGLGPYTYSMVSGGGSISASGDYTAPPFASTDIVQVTDSLGATSQSTITVNAAVAISPVTKTLAVQNTFIFTATNGVGALSFSIVAGGGTINSFTGAYTAPNTAGSATVRVTDSMGNTSDASVTINSALAISPSTKALSQNLTFTFTATGGVSPYTFSMHSGLGSVTAGGFYTAASSGVDIVRVTDSLGNFSDSTVTVTPSISINPATKNLAINNIFNFSVTGGVGPFVYSINSGGGTIDPGTGLYTAPGSSGSATVRVTDSLGNTSDSLVTINPALAINPGSKILAVNNTFTFTATDGAPPYSYSKVSGAGTINSSTGFYSAPSAADTAVIRVTDSAGNTSDAAITINAALAISPTTKTLSVNNTFNFTATGGVAPYVYSVNAGTGSIDSSTGLYTAPASSGTATVRVTDSLGNTSNSTVTINSAMAISPVTKTLAVNNTYSFSVSGGVAPFVYSLNAGSGSINASTGLYTAPGSAGTATVRVTDSLGNTSDASVTINAALAISPASKNLVANSSTAFTASGGVAPYTYSVSAGIGSINSSTGVYTSPASSGTATVLVTDSLGNTSNASVTVYLALAISPTNSSIVAAGTKNFSASGGIGPYTYSVTSGGGSMSSTTFSGPTTPGTSTIQVTDSIGNTSSTNITITAAPAAKLSLSGPASITAGSCAGPFTISSLDFYDNISGVSSTTTINLADPGNGTFFSASNCSGPITSVQMISGTSSKQFYYSNTTAEIMLFTATDNASVLTASNTLPFTTTTGAAAKIGFIVSPSNSVSMVSISPAIKVAIQDANGNTVTSSNGTIALAIGTNPNTGSLSGTAAVATVNGVATFSDLNIDRSGIGYTLVASLGGFSDTSSSSFNITAGAPTQLSFSAQPIGPVGQGESFPGQPQVTVKDASGNAVTDATNLISLAAYTDSACTLAAPGSLTAANNPVTPTNAIGVFSAVKYSLAGTIYLKATSNTLTSSCSSGITVTQSDGSIFLAPSYVPNDGLAIAHFYIIPKDQGVSVGAGNIVEITASSSNVTFTGGAGTCRTPLATCVKATDQGNGAYTIKATSTVVGSYSFTVVVAGTPDLALSQAKVVTFDTTQFTTIAANTTITSAAHGGKNLYFTGGTATFDSTTVGATFGDIFVRGGTLSHTSASPTTLYKLDINADSFTHQSGSVSATSGYYGGAPGHYSYGPGGVPSLSLAAGASLVTSGNCSTYLSAGGSHAGKGGVGNTLQPGAIYDDYKNPALPGGAGGFLAGGGVARLTVKGGCTINSGATITTTPTRTGAGGSIYLNCGAFGGTAGANAIKADGGASYSYSGSACTNSGGGAGTTTQNFAAGGGGRIALISTNEASSFTGSFIYPTTAGLLTTFKSMVMAKGGVGTASYANGGAGTIYLKHAGLTYGDLIIDNGTKTNNAGDGNTLMVSMAGTVNSAPGSNTLPVNVTSTPVSNSTAYNSLYAGMRIRPDVLFNNGTVNDWSDDNVFTVSTNDYANSQQTLTVSGDASAISNGATFRSIDILDHLDIANNAQVETYGDVYVLSGGLTNSSLAFTNAYLSFVGSGESNPSPDTTLSSGVFAPDNTIKAGMLVVSGATVTATNIVAANYTHSSGTTTVTTMNVAQDSNQSGGTLNATTLNVSNNYGQTAGTASLMNLNVTGNVTLSGTATMNHPATTATVMKSLQAFIGGNLSLSNTSKITGSSLGYTGISTGGYSFGSTAPSTSLGSTTILSTNRYGDGGSHGGKGGHQSGAGTTVAGVTYDDYRNPSYPGGGAYTANGARTGGGVVHLTVAGSCTINSGTSITANAATYSAAGGSIYLKCASFAGTAGASAISAVGGTAVSASGGGGGGGGGRIAIISTGNTNSFSGSFAYPVDAAHLTSFKSVVKASGGAPVSATYPGGGAGTIYLMNSDLTSGDLIIDNGGQTLYANSGTTDFVSATDNASTVYASPDADTLQITNGSTPFANKTDLFANHKVHVFPLASSADPYDNSHVSSVLVSNTTNNLVASGNPYPGITNDYIYRFVYQLDHLDIGGNARVDMKGADLMLDTPYNEACDRHSVVAGTLDVPVNSKITGNSFGSTDCASSKLSTAGTTVIFTNYFLP